MGNCTKTPTIEDLNNPTQFRYKQPSSQTNHGCISDAVIPPSKIQPLLDPALKSKIENNYDPQMLSRIHEVVAYNNKKNLKHAQVRDSVIVQSAIDDHQQLHIVNIPHASQPQKRVNLEGLKQY